MADPLSNVSSKIQEEETPLKETVKDFFKSNNMNGSQFTKDTRPIISDQLTTTKPP